ncbi:MAG: FAD:protein FMN transferase [Chloroflexota bacterium]
MRRVESLMGTVASLVVLDADPAPEVLDEAFAWLHEADRRFSPYKEDSEVSRFSRGELRLDDASADLREVLRLCEELRVASDGAFDAGRWRPDGRPDPTGLVKGWAAERAGLMLTAGGLDAWCLNVGGDVVVRGETAPGEGWRVGIRHPDDAQRIVAVLEVRDLAVATSGAYERGEHIVDGRTGKPADGVRSMTVVGPSLTLADGYATAAFAMGREGVAWVARIPGYGAAAVTLEERLLSSPLVKELMLPAEG